MSIEIHSDKEIEKMAKKKEIIFHVCMPYEEGMPLTATMLGKEYHYEISKCAKCKRKVIFTKSAQKFGKLICVVCANKQMKKMKPEDVMGIIREEDRAIYEMAEMAFIKREAKRQLTFAG